MKGRNNTMKKDFLTALIEELSKLRDEQKTITIPAPPSPVDVLKVISRVAEEHEVSVDDMIAALSIRSMLPGNEGITAADVKLIQDLKNSEGENKE